MSSTETEEIPYLKLSNQLTPQKVLYLDLEMSVEQICSRYSTKDKNGNITYYEHHPNFFRIEIDKTQTLKDTDYINVIEEKVIETGSKIVFIDNLTMIGSELSHPDVSRDFMKKILGLRDRHNLTIIMIGHPNKFDIRLKKDITMMKGNMNIGSLVHSVFCISPTLQGQNIRYIIQMKTRFEELLFTDRQVIEMYLEKTENGNIGFHFVGYNKEDNLLKDPEMTLEEMIENMYEENTSITSPKLRDLLYDTYNSGKSSPDSFEKKCLRYLNKIKNRKNR